MSIVEIYKLSGIESQEKQDNSLIVNAQRMANGMKKDALRNIVK